MICGCASEAGTSKEIKLAIAAFERYFQVGMTNCMEKMIVINFGKFEMTKRGSFGENEL